MEKNECTADRAIRVILGLVLIYTGIIQIVLTGALSYVIALIGLLLLITGAIGHCGLYSVLGINTCKIKTEYEEVI